MKVKIFEFDLQLFGGKGGDTTVQSYQPSEYELELQKISKDYANAVAPNAKYLNDTARSVLQNSLGTVQVDFNGLNKWALNRMNESTKQIDNIIGDNNTNAEDYANILADLYHAYGDPTDEDENGQIAKNKENLANSTNNLTDLIEGIGTADKKYSDTINSLTPLLGRDTQNINNELANYISKNNTATNDIGKIISDIAGSNSDATNYANRLLGNYIGQGTDAVNGTNADLSDYIKANGYANRDARDSLSGLQNGTIPTAYQNAMQDAISSALKATVGSTVNSLGQRGVLNSSVTSSALNDIEKNAADSVAQNYLNNINTLQSLTQNKFDDALRTSQLNANLSQQQLGNMQDAIDRNTQLTQQRLSNTLGTNSTNAQLGQQQYTNIYNNLNRNAELANQQYQNNLNQYNTQADWANRLYSNANSTAQNQASLYGQQFNQASNALNNQANLANSWISNQNTKNNTNATIYGTYGYDKPVAAITTAAAAQEAAQQPALNLWNASIGLNGSTTGALSAAKGTGTTSTSGGGGGGFLGGLFGGLF